MYDMNSHGFFFFSSKLIGVTRAAAPRSPVVGRRVWDSVGAVVSRVWPSVDLREQRNSLMHKWAQAMAQKHTHRRAHRHAHKVVKAKETDSQTWPDLVMNKKKALGSA